MPQDRVGVLIASPVVPVEVPPSQGAAIVAHNDSVWVQHGHHFEDEGITKSLVELCCVPECVLCGGEWGRAGGGGTGELQ